MFMNFSGKTAWILISVISKRRRLCMSNYLKGLLGLGGGMRSSGSHSNVHKCYLSLHCAFKSHH